MSEKGTPRTARAPAKSRKEQAQQTRARLKDATRSVLGRIGYRQMRIADITTEAGVAVGLFYHYFPDLKAITAEVLSDFMAGMTQKARQIPQGGDLFDTLYEQYKILIGHFEEHPGLVRCMLQASDEIPEFGQIWDSSNRQWTASFARYLGECCKPARLDDATLTMMAYCLGSMSDGVLQEYYVQRNPDLLACTPSIDALSEMLAVLTYRAVFLTNPPPEKLAATKELLAVPGTVPAP
ncbi:TetR/AcrR family transcriptional regulator [Niveispirillum fermenti]|uniref:TetR/AcrR family transcriptional regulator n=1 Tax=Niveispirillum fermenti TaxID=1233113 RepID=UPI003A8A2505